MELPRTWRILATLGLAVVACSSDPAAVSTADDAVVDQPSSSVADTEPPDSADPEPEAPATSIAAEKPKEFTTDVLPMCADLPDIAPADDDEFSEAQLISLANQVWSTVGIEFGLQGAGIGRENRVGLEFVDPPIEGFEARLAQLPDGYCIDAIAFTPEPPAVLDVIDDSGGVSALPDGVERVEILFPRIGGAPAPDATEFTLSLSEQACASGREMGDRLLPLEVHESADEILIAAGVVIQLTGQECPSNPATEVTVTLNEPVGDREILNAFSGDAVETSTE